MVETTSKKRMGCCEMVQAFIFMIWDGLGFFGFSPNKIDRLKGILPRWWDRFFNLKYMVMNTTFAVIIISFLVQ